MGDHFIKVKITFVNINFRIYLSSVETFLDQLLLTTFLTILDYNQKMGFIFRVGTESLKIGLYKS